MADVDISNSEPTSAYFELAPQAEADDYKSEMVEDSSIGKEKQSIFVLIFPWGDVEITETLFVGRDLDLSPLAPQIIQAGLQWVSCKHAEIYKDEGKLFVRDVGSTNGTFVNGRLIGSRPVALADGDQLGFSRRLFATVRSK